ncbi:5-oxoprolinase subunit B/C family protein [Paracoccus beibuensis]|uniref:5-oxoprolinase subunit B/C family protein n=1 Tax=Paracoccus beibuensis TaxID=547602 RepID=UPI002240938E|nr:urea amidolyase family protein [Paracoccus beibuensis]
MIRFLPVGPRCFLAELADLDATLALYDALLADPLPGVIDLVPAARTIMVRTAPGIAADAALARAIRGRAAAPPQASDRIADVIELPVTYDGEDLDEVACLMNLTVAEVIKAHQAAIWQVAFCGFAPGFAYMTCDDARFDLPRRTEPRTRIPAGSVALAGRFCGVYPQESPGGWQLIGRTDAAMWDLSREPPALLRPGMRVRFVPGRVVVRSDTPAPTAKVQGLRVQETAFPILVQDLGRPGQAGQGVSASGALDRGALRRANRAVGNPAGAPALEVTSGPVRLLAEVSMTLALSGAARATFGAAAVEPGGAFALDAGDHLQIAAATAGMRSYLAVRGGFQVQRTLGSAATDTLAHVGPSPLVAGDALALAHQAAMAVSDPDPAPDLPAIGDVVNLPVTLGPRTDWFDDSAVQSFLAQEWLVTRHSSRVGIRLSGGPILRPDAAELPSEGCAAGAIQVPHSGQPVLFLADHPLTGGYPVIATLQPDTLDLAGQLPPGARIRFDAAAPFAPIDPEG